VGLNEVRNACYCVTVLHTENCHHTDGFDHKMPESSCALQLKP